MAEWTLGQTGVEGFLEGATLVPVPMHRGRQLERGYNQAELYARALADLSGSGYEERLVRARVTDPQNRLDITSRRENPAGSIALRDGSRPPGRRVVVVDDVYTTGSTASECARVLVQEAGAEVDVWTFARTVKRWSKGAHYPMGD